MIFLIQRSLNSKGRYRGAAPTLESALWRRPIDLNCLCTNDLLKHLTSNSGIHGQSAPGTNRFDLVRDFLNCIGPRTESNRLVLDQSALVRGSQFCILTFNQYSFLLCLSITKYIKVKSFSSQKNLNHD